MTPENKTKLKVWKEKQSPFYRLPLTAEQEEERRQEILIYRRKQMTPLEQIRFCIQCNRNELHVYRDFHMHCYKCWTMNCGIFHPCHCNADLNEEDNCAKCGASYFHLKGILDD